MLKTSYRNADIAGYSPALRVELSFHNNILGYLGVNEGNKFLFGNTDAIAFFATNWINQELEWTKFYEEIDEHFDNLLLISPHSNLESHFSSHFHGSIESIVIPSENHPLVNKSSIRAPHYPDIFLRVLDYAPKKNALCLIAGGIFGKIYCDYFKSKGCIAIDIRIIADFWMGIKTR